MLSKRMNPFLILLLFLSINTFITAQYNPLAIPAGFKSNTIDLTVKDDARKREIPLRIYLPEGNEKAPVILFSHGLGGSREGSVFLGRHWSARGYIAVFLQHPGSDESVWKDKRPLQKFAAMKKAANVENFLLRIKDVSVVLNQLEKWNADEKSVLKGRLDMEHVGMSGHSFGAITTQGVSGQKFDKTNISFTDTRIKASLILSPGASAKPNEETFKYVKIPWMLMTGTKDVSPIGDIDFEDRLEVFKALPPGNKYLLILNNAEHSVFTDRALPQDKEPRNPNHHKSILALSTAFWDSYLKNDLQAKLWLDGNGPQTILEPNDKWEKK